MRLRFSEYTYVYETFHLFLGILWKYLYINPDYA